MKPWWVEREIAVPAGEAWALLVDVERWPEWGPSVSDAGLDGEVFDLGATGWVRTAVGVRVPFEITSFDDGAQWGWKVAGVPATGHRVRPVTDDRCVVGLGVPPLVAAYALVCRRALATIDRILTS
ncbi:MAG: SRPBCC family protein [Ilumatobacter fluminis]|uniref:SRPBCC family protein n=1 Tax=Ilumatobacter fluminis TaxID=467091 RepID=UPI0032EC7B8D